MVLAEFIVTFREFFEIALLVGIMLAYLYKTGNRKYEQYVYFGVVLAALASLGAALAFEQFAGGFEANEELFEGITLVLAAVFVSWLILWMFKQQKLVEKIHQRLQVHIDEGQKAGLVLFAFIAVFREGIEIILFLAGIQLNTGAVNVFGALLGIVAALGLGYAFFSRLVHLNLKKFFNVTSFVLVLLAAGLLGQGVHELQEAKVLPTYIEHVYNITPPLNPDGSYPPLHEKGAIGSVLKGIVGYDTGPSEFQLLAHVGYLGLMYYLYWRIQAKKTETST